MITFLVILGIAIAWIICGLLTLKLGVHFEVMEMETMEEDDPSIIFIVIFWPLFFVMNFFILLYRLIRPIIRWTLR